jgi:hypothetical protein
METLAISGVISIGQSGTNFLANAALPDGLLGQRRDRQITKTGGGPTRRR